jgi:hypothetical protein
MTLFLVPNSGIKLGENGPEDWICRRGGVAEEFFAGKSWGLCCSSRPCEFSLFGLDAIGESPPDEGVTS